MKIGFAQTVITPPVGTLDNTWANLLDIELDNALVEGITFERLSNETVIDLMGVTLLRGEN